MKTQKIKRSDLKIIYKSNICDSWKKIVAELAIFDDSKEIEVENELILRAYNEANSEQKKLVEKYFKIVSNNIKDKIKTLKDVYEHLNIKREDVIPFLKPKNKLQKSANAFIDINHISLTLNEGWIANFNGGTYNYYPYFEKKSHGWVVGSFIYFGDFALVGSGFYYKNSELALYAGNQFLDVYKDYLPE